MEQKDEKLEPAIPWLIRRWKEKSKIKKQREIEDLKLEIEKAKLEKQLKEIKNGDK